MGSIGHCIVRDNEGNGIEHWYCGGSIARSTIFSNQGCGIWVTGPTYQYPTTPDAPMLLWMNLIYGNHGGEGGGVQCSNGANPILRNNTIVRNFGGFGAGVSSARRGGRAGAQRRALQHGRVRDHRASIEKPGDAAGRPHAARRRTPALTGEEARQMPHPRGSALLYLHR